MTSVKEREVTYVEKDAKAPLVISDNPADHVAFNKKDENWRYIPSKKFDVLATSPITSGNPLVDVLNASKSHKISYSGVAGLRVRDIITANNIAAEHNEFVIDVDKSANGKLVEINYSGSTPSNSVIQVNVASQVEAQILLRDFGQADTSLNLAINLGNGAIIKFVFITEQSAKGMHFGQISANVGRDASLTMGIVSLGGDLVRRSFDSLFNDVNGEMILLGATHSADGQYCEHRTVVDHNTPNCRSYVDFRSAVDGQGTHSVWIGDTIIRYSATGSDTYETNRNLVLSAGARADSVPNLEIETGEVVGAGHASATGRLDDEQIFYLTSRGLKDYEALKLIVVGFFANIVERMGISTILQPVVETIESKLKSVGDL
ncbi:MAG: hypothetical protein FJW76_05270 [Actinobacteria bacterium]|nr:hypothetical protein [Actinomycetota bacterium]